MSRKLLNLLAKPRNLNRIRSSVGRKSDWIATRSYATGPVGAGPESAVEGRAKSIVGPFSIRAGALFLLTGSGLFYYFQAEKDKVELKKKQETANAKIGKPKIGGPFVLLDQDGKERNQDILQGRWSLVYFGFTNCPDICPEELDKMGLVVNSIAKSDKVEILPIFITCDPVRDTVEVVKTYVSDFHPALIGLTGTYEAIKKCCKQYRVYFSTPPSSLPTDDYLVDHSIFFYLMDPNGKFVDAFGRSMGEDEVAKKVGGYIGEWAKGGGRGGWTE